SARVSVESNHVINVLAALRLNTTNAPEKEAKSAPAPKPYTRKSGLMQKLGGFIQEALASKTNLRPLAPKIAVGAVVISNAAVQFNDESVQPAVKASLDEVNGTIQDISADELKRADLHLTARVGRAGPVEITGKVNPLSQNS